MSTSPIRPGGRKVPAKRSAGGVKRATAPGHVPAGGSPTPENSLPTYAQMEARQVRGLGRDRAALQAHVEQALVGFFGQRLALAPRFQDIVCQTVDALLAEPALEDDVQAACRMLSSELRQD